MFLTATLYRTFYLVGEPLSAPWLPNSERLVISTVIPGNR